MKQPAISMTGSVRIGAMLAALLLGTNACRRADAPPEAPPAPTSDPVEQATVRLIAEGHAVVPGARLTLAVEFLMSPTWYTYWKNPGESGLAPIIHWTLPEGVRFERLHYPTPEWFDDDGIVSFGYEDRVWILADFASDDTLEGVVEIEAAIDWMICKEMCVPVESSAALRIPVATVAEPDASVQAEFDRWRARLPQDASDWSFAVTRSDDELTVSLRPDDRRLAASPPWEQVRLFPVTVGSTEPSVPTRWQHEDGRWVAHLAAGPEARPGRPFEAVLALSDADGIVGWRLAAELGE